MDETEVIYGTIGMVPMGEYDPDVKYELLNLVSYDGSSYTVHTDPPIGTLPTDTNYWQLSAQGTSKATASTPGTVMPDGETTEVDSNGALSVKTATDATRGLVKGSDGIKVAEDGSIDVNTLFAQATELANIIAGEAITTALGKISKSIAVTMGLNENAVLKSMITNMDVNDSTKLNSAAYVHKLTERIGMGEELAAGANLTAGLNALNSNLNEKANVSDLAKKQDKSILTLPVGTNIFAYADDFQLGYSGMFRVMNGPIYPEGYTSSNDFWFNIIRLNDPNVKYWRIIAYDIRANRTFSASCINGSIVSWKEL